MFGSMTMVRLVLLLLLLLLLFFFKLCLGVDGGKVTILAFDTNRWGFGNIGVVGVEKYFGSLI